MQCLICVCVCVGLGFKVAVISRDNSRLERLRSFVCPTKKDNLTTIVGNVGRSFSPVGGEISEKITIVRFFFLPVWPIYICRKYYYARQEEKKYKRICHWINKKSLCCTRAEIWWPQLFVEKILSKSKWQNSNKSHCLHQGPPGGS